MTRGYTSQAAVELVLQRPLGAEETGRFAGVASAVEAYIDRRTGRAWAGAVPAEQVPVARRLAQLRAAPVVSVDEVRATVGAYDRATAWPVLDPAPTTLDPATDYVVEAAAGVVWLLVDGYDRLEVDYTLADTPPGDIREAATLLVAAWLPGGSASGAGFSQLKLGDDTYTFAPAGSAPPVPVGVAEILAARRRPVLV